MVYFVDETSFVHSSFVESRDKLFAYAVLIYHNVHLRLSSIDGVL